MSETNDISNEDVEDLGPAQPLEISSEIAAKADDLLRRFAEEAGLETALVVDRSGALVAGISSEAEVTIDVISALVAGASGAMRALVKELGETGNIESLHQGGDRLLYLREMINRFILVGVSDCSTPAGVVREEASKVSDALQEILVGIKPSDPPKAQKELAPMKSLRSMSLQRTANRLLAPAVFLEEEEIPETPVEIVGEAAEPPVRMAPEPIIIDEPVAEPEPEPEPVVMDEPAIELEAALGHEPEVNEDEVIIEETLEEEVVAIEESEPILLDGVAPESIFEAIEEDEALEEEPELIEAPEPKEVLEPLDFGETEIVIEQPSLRHSSAEEVDFRSAAPAPAQVDEVVLDAESVASIFEVAADAEPEIVFEMDPEEADLIEVVSDDEAEEETEEEAETIFEFDEADSGGGVDESDPVPVAFEIDEDQEAEDNEAESDRGDSDETEDDEIEDESEGRTSGPFYF